MNITFRNRRGPGLRRQGMALFGIAAFLLCFLATLVIHPLSQGYVMPSEQIFQFLSANFLSIHTVRILQIARLKGAPDGDGDRLLQERVWMKSPDFVRTEVLDPPGVPRALRDERYRQLLMANSEGRLQRLLAEMGINLELVAYTRVEGTVAYRIGGGTPESPKLCVEKERFLPLVLVYRSGQGPEGGMIQVEFRDYRKVSDAWHPFEIVYSFGEGSGVTLCVQEAATNVSVDLSGIGPSHTGPAPEKGLGEGEARAENAEEKDRLRRIIKTFERQYP